MKRFTKDPKNRVDSFWKKNRVLGEVKQDEAFIVECPCLFGNPDDLKLVQDAWKEENRHLKIPNMTGAIFIEGANPGDTLEVKIVEVKLTSNEGYMEALPGIGCFGSKIEKLEYKKIPQDQNYIYFSKEIRFPSRPMLGKIGIAPLGPAMPSAVSGQYGGNMDNKEICKGATIYLPIFVEGGLLCVGDIHAAQGDGELISGVETEADVTLITRVLNNFEISYPVLVNDKELMTIANGKNIEEAASIALDEMAKILVKRLNISYVDAAFLLSAAGDVRINQIVDPLFSVRVCIPRSIVPAFD